MPDTVTSIGAFAFYGAESLAYMPLAHTALETVGERAMTNCSSLLSVEIPSNVFRMGYAFLEGCGKLETLTIPFVGRYHPGVALSIEEQRAVSNGDAPARLPRLPLRCRGSYVYRRLPSGLPHYRHPLRRGRFYPRQRIL